MKNGSLLMFNPENSITAIDRLDFGNLTPVEGARLEQHVVELERRVREDIARAGGDSSDLDSALADIQALERETDDEAWALRLTAMCMKRDL